MDTITCNVKTTNKKFLAVKSSDLWLIGPRERSNGRVKRDVFFTLYPSVLFDFLFYYEHIFLLLKKKNSFLYHFAPCFIIAFGSIFLPLIFSFRDIQLKDDSVHLKKFPTTTKQQKD